MSERKYKPLIKKQLCQLYGIGYKPLRLRLEILEEEQKISPAWRKISLLSSDTIAEFVRYFGKPSNENELFE